MVSVNECTFRATARLERRGFERIISSRNTWEEEENRNIIHRPLHRRCRLPPRRCHRLPQRAPVPKGGEQAAGETGVRGGPVPVLPLRACLLPEPPRHCFHSRFPRFPRCPRSRRAGERVEMQTSASAYSSRPPRRAGWVRGLAWMEGWVHIRVASGDRA